jgi:CDP-glucose 4,6-dehydratase
MIEKAFWKNKKVFVTGHTGFKGAWLCLWLHSLGAEVTGFTRKPPKNPSLYECSNLGSSVRTITGDIRSKKSLHEAVMEAKPDIVFHMAAQPLVRTSYDIPVETYEINVMGTVNLLDAVRLAVQNGIPVKAVINVTSEKCYEDKEWASARSGNVIGGGDWGANRLIPDFIRALQDGTKLTIRNPRATRPWMHVLAVLEGYLLLAQKLCEDGRRYSQSWNFGPGEDGAKSVEWIVRKLCEKWGENAAYEIGQVSGQHEAHYMKMDCSKARSELGWQPKWDLDHALDRIVEFTRAHQQNQDLRSLCLTQIEQYGA